MARMKMVNGRIAKMSAQEEAELLASLPPAPPERPTEAEEDEPLEPEPDEQ